jgi:hypothetical protein
VSDAQFVGDLFGLFKRHRIETGEAGSFAQFESLLASKDTFRSQLFTLCTAISHMADEDLSGEQLLDLIARALGDPEGDSVPESARKAFLSGYDAWSNRHLDADDTWPPVRQSAPVNEPIPFPHHPAETATEPAPPAARPTVARPAGTRTVQEALLMAKKEAAFELPPRTATQPGTSVEGLTISELTKLLEEIEHRMTRIKPQVSELSGLVLSPAESSEWPTKVRDIGESSRAAAAAPLGPSLVAASVPTSPLAVDEPLLIGQPDPVKEDKFMARHAYLNPGRRLPPNAAVPELRSLAIPVAVAPVAYVASPPPPLALVPPVEAASPVVFAVPDSALMAAAVTATALPVATPANPTLVGLASRGAIVDHSSKLPIAVVYKSEASRLYFHMALGVFAAFLIVACPLAGVVLFRSLHPVHHYVYHGLAPEAQTDGDVPGAPVAGDAPSATATPNSELPTAVPWGSVPAKSDGTRATAHSRPGHRSASEDSPRRQPSVAVWPPPPQ